MQLTQEQQNLEKMFIESGLTYEGYVDLNRRIKQTHKDYGILNHIEDVKKVNEKNPLQDIIQLQNGQLNVLVFIANTLSGNIAVSNPSALESWRGWTFRNKTRKGGQLNAIGLTFQEAQLALIKFLKAQKGEQVSPPVPSLDYINSILPALTEQLANCRVQMTHVAKDMSRVDGYFPKTYVLGKKKISDTIMERTCAIMVATRLNLTKPLYVNKIALERTQTGWIFNGTEMTNYTGFFVWKEIKQKGTARLQQIEIIGFMPYNAIGNRMCLTTEANDPFSTAPVKKPLYLMYLTELVSAMKHTMK